MSNDYIPSYLNPDDLGPWGQYLQQVDRVTPHDGSRGTLINQTRAFRSGHTAHVASVALDFVY